ncbi:MAG: peptidylprolyl isomerase [Muribaculaceae bacterium]|nr:peptidylprolyl isomerase [Muribaculaceae bacterium]
MNFVRTFAVFVLASVALGMSAYEPADSVPGNTYVTVSTNVGDFTLMLYDDTPLHRDNFIRLCQDGTYDGVLFHRVIKDFLIQGGDPNSRERIPGKPYGDGDGGFCVYSEILPHHFCKRGALIDAKLGDDVNPTRMSAGTQFCVVQGSVLSDEELDAVERRLNEWQKNYLYHLARYELMLEDPSLSTVENGNLLNAKARERALWQSMDQGPVVISPEHREVYRTIGGTPHLDGSVTVFGELVDGQDIVEKITLMETDEMDRPLSDVIILSTSVSRR